MKPLYFGINKQGERDISETTENLQIHRTVLSSKKRSEDILKNKEQVLKEIPFCSMLDSLEKKLRDEVNIILDDEDDSCMNCIDLHNEE